MLNASFYVAGVGVASLGIVDVSDNPYEVTLTAPLAGVSPAMLNDVNFQVGFYGEGESVPNTVRVYGNPQIKVTYELPSHVYLTTGIITGE